jgi:integrase/recombinase XerD
VAQPGRALAWGARGRQFKSARPDQSTRYERNPQICGSLDPLSWRNRLLPKFQQFIRERQYLHNVSPATISWHTHNLKWLPSEFPTEEQLKEVVVRMREKGLRASGCNSAIRSINAYLKWTGSPFKVPQMKEPQHVLPTYTQQQLQLLLGWKPKKITGHRLSTFIAFIADTGCRIDEALSLHWKDVDFDNLLVLLHGKGSKDRLVPISLELRKRLFLFQRKTEARDGLVFGTQGGTKQGRRNVLRDFKSLCRSLGFEPPERSIHAMRHTFAVHYLRKGGSVFHLQKMLGHSSLEMTRRYANLMTEDLQAVHQRLSLLG